MSEEREEVWFTLQKDSTRQEARTVLVEDTFLPSKKYHFVAGRLESTPPIPCKGGGCSWCNQEAHLPNERWKVSHKPSDYYPLPVRDLLSEEDLLLMLSRAQAEALSDRISDLPTAVQVRVQEEEVTIRGREVPRAGLAITPLKLYKLKCGECGCVVYSQVDKYRTVCSNCWIQNRVPLW